MTLRLELVTKRFGALVANDSLSLEFAPGRVTSVIGPNGAGKSTLINLCAGSYRCCACCRRDKAGGACPPSIALRPRWDC